MKYQIKLQLQPTNTTCEHAALAMLFDFYDKTMPVSEIVRELPCFADDENREVGIFTQSAAAFAAQHDFAVDLYVFDYLIVDQSWRDLNNRELIAKFQSVRGHRRDAGNLSGELSDLAIDGYIDFLRAGGRLHITRYPSRKLLMNLLCRQPVFLSLCPDVIFDCGGRMKNVALRKSVPDDIEGGVVTHATILRGYENGEFLLADPWFGERSVNPEALTAAIMEAQFSCDNMLFVAHPAEKH